MDHQQADLNLNLITGFLGVPGYILSTFLPTLQQFASRQPRLVKFLCLLVALSTFGTTLLERVKRTLLSFLISNFMFSTTIDASDPLFDYMLRWLKERRRVLPEQELQARSREEVDRNHYNNPGMAPPPPNPRDKKTPHEVVYDFNGLQIFWHQWKPYFVAPHPSGRNGPPHYLAVRCFGFSSQPLKAIVDEAYKIYRQNDQANATAVYRPVSRSGGWKCVARRSRRSLDTIVLDPDEKGRLLEDIKFYLSAEAKDWYGARGIPYRRGYLFHGKPGTGKTSLSMAIAGHFSLDIYIVSLLDPHINDTFLHTFFSNLPKGALILLEDIDSAGLARETAENSLLSYSRRRRDRYRPYQPERATRVTLSGLLNAIDGADSPEGHLLIMTTNAPEALDEALIRPGRIDYKIGFKATGPDQARSIFLRMYQGDYADEENLNKLAEDFAAQTPDNTFTPAELQGHLLRHKKDPEAALGELKTWQDGVLHERAELERAKQKAEARIKRREEKKKAKKKARKLALDLFPVVNGEQKSKSNSTAKSESESDSDSSSSAPDLVVGNADYEDSYHSTLNGDPTYADHGLGTNPSPPPLLPRPMNYALTPHPRHLHRRNRYQDVTPDQVSNFFNRQQEQTKCAVM